jgi:hypothetical protein
VLNLAKQCGVSVPTSKLLSVENLLLEHDFRNKVIKAEYSRFGSDVLIEPNFKDLHKLVDVNICSYVLQEKINGAEVCNYAIAIKGELMLHTAYQPKYRIGKSAGIYFSQVINEGITNFTKALLAKLHYTGQIGFDFIIENDQLYLIECNPRANSGVHLLNNIDIDDCLSNKSKYIDVKNPSPAMIALAMPLYALPNALLKMKIGKFIKDYRAARDVISSRNDNIFIFYQFISLFELIINAMRYRLSLRKASTRDIEWNGRELL